MKITCTTERVVNENTSCTKEYCCKELKQAMEDRKTSNYDYQYSTITLGRHNKKDENKIFLETHNCSHGGSHTECIYFCPFCGTKFKVERKKVDNTGLPLEEMRPIMAAPPKKRRWWNLF